MTLPEQLTLPPDLLLQLWPAQDDPTTDAVALAALGPERLDRLCLHATDRTQRAMEDARGLLEVALETLELQLSADHQRRLLERADDELATALRWGTLAANARFCREQPELARQLGGATADGARSGRTGKRQRGAA
ncbi:hypothetical protein ASE35_14090 [Lysobacter sp. Root916]|uniref:hypothetical protein n=1 Tax=Lysobacter sp. Root916 TaxID=1736606 RepID=UPI000709C8EA|nr:hypothetical protein [Lysobacter sp. Root916]KRD32078.1 hypothetical protein ASE35_14090 [Lysobacter sp. Root916]